MPYNTGSGFTEVDKQFKSNCPDFDPNILLTDAHDMEVARGIATAACEIYGDLDEHLWKQLKERGIWNDRAEVQAALLALRVSRSAGDIGPKSQAARDILEERARQITVEGWTPEHDDDHSNGEMACAAAAYAFQAGTTGRYFTEDPIGFWPWDPKWWKPKGPRRDLVRAAALIIAEIERLDRQAGAEDTANA